MNSAKKIIRTYLKEILRSESQIEETESFNNFVLDFSKKDNDDSNTEEQVVKKTENKLKENHEKVETEKLVENISNFSMFNNINNFTD